MRQRDQRLRRDPGDGVSPGDRDIRGAEGPNRKRPTLYGTW
jgi:hypothetical protein